MCTEAIKEYFITDNTDFYGLWEKNEKTYMVTLKVHGAVVRWLVGEFRTVVDLPKDIPSELHKDNCTLLGWADKHEHLSTTTLPYLQRTSSCTPCWSAST